MSLALALERFVLAGALLAIVAWVIAWRRARPDLCPRFLAVKLVVLLTLVAASALFSGLGLSAPLAWLVGAAAVAAVAIALRLWIEHRWLLMAADAPHEARRLADAALDLTATVTKGKRDASGG